MQGYFGVSSLEALSQGVPTLAGLDAWNVEQVGYFTGTSELPWVLVRDPAQLREALIELSADVERRTELGRDSRAWMERYWSEAAIADRLSAVYREC